MDNGSSILEPISNAVVGHVGEIKRSTFSNEFKKSCVTNFLTYCAFL